MQNKKLLTGPARLFSRRNFVKFSATLAVAVRLAGLAPGMQTDARAATGKPQKVSLKFRFIKPTDMVPLAIAYEKGYSEDEGLSVTLEAQANWKALLDRVISGEFDGANMLADQPIGTTIGFGTKADVITPFSMDLNGNGITVSNTVWAKLKKKLPMKDGQGGQDSRYRPAAFADAQDAARAS